MDYVFLMENEELDGKCMEIGTWCPSALTLVQLQLQSVKNSPWQGSIIQRWLLRRRWATILPLLSSFCGSFRQKHHHDHIQSKKHKSRTEAEKDDPSNWGTVVKQTMITGYRSQTQSSQSWIAFTLIFVKCLVLANVLFEKVTQFCWFLEKYTHQGGTLPQPSTLQKEYLLFLLS